MRKQSGSMHMEERKKEPYMYPYLGVAFGIGFVVVGILEIIVAPLDQRISGVLFMLLGLAGAVYYGYVAIKRWEHQKYP